MQEKEKNRAFPRKYEAVFGQETRQTKESRASFRCNRNGISSSPNIWFLLIVVGSAYLASRYDFQLSTLTIPQFKASLGLSDANAANITALVKLGAIPAVLITFFADRIGRKPIFLVSIIGFSISAIIAANAHDANSLLLGLFLTRLFTMIGELLAVVILSEAAPPKSRAFLLGALAIFGTFGDAFAIIGYGFFGDKENSWRVMYMIGAFPALLAIWWKSSLKETSAFEHAKGQKQNQFAQLLGSKKQLAITFLALFLFWIPISPALSLVSKYLQNSMGWNPAGVSTITMISGVLGMLGTTFGGALADKFGRRPIGIFAMLMCAIGLFGVYWFKTEILIGAMFGFGLIGWFAFLVSTRALIVESVETNARATATGASEIFATLGAYIGVQAVGLFLPFVSNEGTIIRILMPFVFFAAIALYFTKETKGKIID